MSDKVKDDLNTIVHFKWILDEMTSTILIMELDKDGDGSISKRENDFIYNAYFLRGNVTVCNETFFHIVAWRNNNIIFHTDNPLYHVKYFGFNTSIYKESIWIRC